jgi:hypothetical protein
MHLNKTSALVEGTTMMMIMEVATTLVEGTMTMEVEMMAVMVLSKTMASPLPTKKV